jgi:DNA-binding protein HU-beta
MTKAELVTAVQAAAKVEGLTKGTVNDLVDTVFGELGKALKKDGRFAVPAFGTFTVRKRAARKGRNPRTGEAIKIKASKTVAFKPAPSMKKGL